MSSIRKHKIELSLIFQRYDFMGSMDGGKMVTANRSAGALARALLKTSVWLFILAGVSISILLPHVVAPIAERLILQKTASVPGLEHLALNVETVGLSGVGIGNISTGESISVDSVFCRYSPASLMQKKINRLDISGLEIKGVIDGSAPPLADFSSISDSSEVFDGGENSRFKDIGAILPFLPPDIEIRHSFITLKYNETLMAIPFSLLCKIDHKNSTVKLLLTLLPLGQKINIALDADVRNFDVSGKNSQLKHLFRSVVLNANNVSWEPLTELISIVAPDSDIRLAEKSDITLVMGGDLSKWKLDVSHIGIKEPVEGEINNVVMNLTFNDFYRLFKSEEVMATQSESGQTEQEFSLPKTEPNLPEKEKGISDRDITQSENGSSQPQIEPPSLYPAVSAQGSFWSGGAMVSPVNVTYGLAISSDRRWSLSIKGREMWEQKPFTIQAGGAQVKIHAPDFNVDCKGEGGVVDGTVTSTMGRVLFENEEVALEGVMFQFPLKYGESVKGVHKKERRSGGLKGSLNVDGIQYKGRKIASLKSTLMPVSAREDGGQGDTGVTLEGKIVVDGVATIPVKSKVLLLKDKRVTADFDYQLNPTTVTPDMVRKLCLAYEGQQSYSDAKGGAEILSGMDFGFTLASRGGFVFHDNQMESSLTLDLSGGTFSIPEKKINLSGIRTSLRFNDLPAMRSMAGQILTIDKINIKDLKISDSKIRYTIESNRSNGTDSGKGGQHIPALLIEDGSFNWCDGKVISDSIRFSPSESDYHMSLFCDRLKLSSILQQLGGFDAEGEGTLNGRIPVSFSGGNITFDNGFLYSTPGQGGKIKVFGTDKLTEGIPMDTPQFAQIDLAKEALKNYRYEWAKLGFNSQGDQLTVKMEFDGKPENPLPFVYKRDIGAFVRVSGKGAGSHFQAIKIDLNLQLPFNRMLKFGNTMNNLFK